MSDLYVLPKRALSATIRNKNEQAVEGETV